jgi:hypothetical protein
MIHLKALYKGDGPYELGRLARFVSVVHFSTLFKAHNTLASQEDVSCHVRQATCNMMCHFPSFIECLSPSMITLSILAPFHRSEQSVAGLLLRMHALGTTLCT